MAYELHIQDPSWAGTHYLDEELVALLRDPGISEIEGLFAFATVTGAAAFVGDPAFAEFADRGGTLRLLLGLDAITNKVALEYLIDRQTHHGARLVVKVFKNDRPGLFHPKLVRVARTDGGTTLLVGSGNLTTGGLRSNIEAYSVARFSAASPPDVSEWDRFIRDHASEISDIDGDALARGERNAERVAASRAAAKATGATKPGGVKAGEAEAAFEVATEDAILGDELDRQKAVAERFLVAEVPKAGTRWQQVHLNGDVTAAFFQAAPHTAERVLLYRREPLGGYVQEPPRPVVLSGTNLNHRIEFGANKGAPYPAASRPILVLREVGLRTFTYVMLLPGQPGHAEMDGLLAARPSLGRGMRRVITVRSVIAAAWPGLPL